MINYVTGFLFSSDRKDVALITKINPEWQRGFINGVGGKIELGESPEQAMSREFHEETGVKIIAEQWLCYCVIRRPAKYCVYFLMCIDDNVYNVKSVEKEFVGVYKTNDLPFNVISNLRWLIPMALDENLIFSQPVLLEEYRVIGKI